MFGLTDDYFQYESDEFSSLLQEPVLKLLTKRQAPDTSKEAMKKPASSKPQTVSNPENSSNPKPTPSGNKVAVLSDENSKTYV